MIKPLGKKLFAAKKKPKPKKTTDFFCALCRSDIKIEMVMEHIFLVDRRYRFDYANLEFKIAIEKDGGVWMKGGGAHSRPQNILRDMEKLTLANVNGWIVIRRTPQQLHKRETLDLILQAVNQRKKEVNL